MLKLSIGYDFKWYEANSAYQQVPHVDFKGRSKDSYSVLYSKKRGILIDPSQVVTKLVAGDAVYPSLLEYVEKVIQENV